MSPEPVELLFPACFEEFSCIGPACADNCCHSWEIDLDKDHYLRYKAAGDAQFRAQASRVLRRRKEGATPLHYAYLSLAEDGRCGFQDGDGGCRVYRALGPDSLCPTCAVYPRRKTQFHPGVWELSLSLSCPEAARLVLFGDGAVELKTKSHTPVPGDPMDEMPPAGIGPGGGVMDPPPYADALRSAAMTLMTCRRYEVRERILAVGLLLRRTDRFLAAGAGEQIPLFAAQFLRSVEAGEFEGFFDRLDYAPKAHLSALSLPAAHLLAGARKPVLRHLWGILEPWCRRDATGEYFAEDRAFSFLLSEAQAKGDPLLAQYPEAVERYFVSYLFSGMFPFLYRWEGLTFEQHGILLAEQYALLRLLAAMERGRDGCGQPDGKESLLRAVVSLARLCQHSDLGQDFVRLTAAVKLDGLAHAAYLLR